MAETDSVTTLSRAFASRFADIFDLVLADPPLADVQLNVVMVWRALADGDPMLAWVRSKLIEAAGC